MPATADVLFIEPPQPARPTRKPKEAPNDEDRQAFPDTMRQVEAENAGKPGTGSESVETTDAAGGQPTESARSAADDRASPEATDATSSSGTAPGDGTDGEFAANEPARLFSNSAQFSATSDTSSGTAGESTAQLTNTASVSSATAATSTAEVAAQQSRNHAMATHAASANQQSLVAAQTPIAQAQPQTQHQAQPAHRSSATQTGPASKVEGASAAQPAGDRSIPASLILTDEALVPELSRIDLAARKTAQAVVNPKSGAITNAAGDAVKPSATALAQLNLANINPARTAETPQATLQSVQQPTPDQDIQPIQIQSAPDINFQPSTTATGQIQPGHGVSASQSLSFAQQMAQSAAQPPAQQLGISIARGIREGLDRIEIQLHPAELGRVDVRMELGHDGRVMAVVSAERSDTLEQLRRDIEQLERALADAGFDLDGNSFRFEEGSQETAAEHDGDDGDLAESGLEIPAQATSAARALHFDGIRIDISV